MSWTGIAMTGLAAIGIAAAQPLVIQQSAGGEVTLDYAVAPGSRAVLEMSPNLTDWRARYAFETGDGSGTIQLPADGARGFFRLRTEAFRVPGGLAWVPPGSFLMGSSVYEQGHEADEGPPREVRIDKGFWMGITEVTVSQYVWLMHANPTALDDYSPVAVHQVSLAEAQEYCRRLTAYQQERSLIPPSTSYRLPSEAEWEYACRAGTQTRFSFGEDPDYDQLPAHAWCRLNCGGPMPVGVKRPNSWGLYDMHGNVFEWCLGWYTPYPEGTRAGYGKLRNYRGGSFYCPLDYLRSASRHPGSEGPSDLIGFRVVLGADPETVLPLNEVAPPEVIVEWAPDGTWARVVATCATPESEVHYSTNGWRPLLGSPVEPPVVTTAATVKVVAFRENFTRSPVVEIQIEQLSPPEARIEAAALFVTLPDAGLVEYAFPGGEWHPWVGAVPVPAGVKILVRTRQPGFLTSPATTLTAPAE